MKKELSLSEKMGYAVHLSWDIMYETLSYDDHYFDPRKEYKTNKNNEDIIDSWGDGLMHKYFSRKSGMDGNDLQKHKRTPAQVFSSVNKMINFDLEEWEKTVDRDIKMMEELSTRLGKPRKMTKEEMRSRGYIIKD